MDDWTARVTAAAADWVYLPPEALAHVTPEVSVVAYEESWDLPTQAMRIRSSASAVDLVERVDRIVGTWGRPDVAWWIDAATRPVGLEEHLLAHGARLAETVTVLAVDLTGPLPDFAVPTEVRADLATDLHTLRDFGRTNATGWDSPEPTDDDLSRWLAETASGQALRVVARVDGTPFATGGLTVVDGVARLWAGVTLPAYRGRGGYRAVLAERLRIARDRGATMGLVKGRVSTSAPILRRLGFDVFDDERAYRRPVAG